MATFVQNISWFRPFMCVAHATGSVAPGHLHSPYSSWAQILPQDAPVLHEEKLQEKYVWLSGTIKMYFTVFWVWEMLRTVGWKDSFSKNAEALSDR